MDAVDTVLVVDQPMIDGLLTKSVDTKFDGHFVFVLEV
jgi:hypothetical protein